MINTSKIIVIFLFSVVLSSCSQVLQTVDLKVNTEDNASQQEFNVVAKTLTIKIAKQQTSAPYMRTMLQNGRGGNAKSIPEKLALTSKFPESKKPFRYKIGIGDVLTYSRLIDNNLSLTDNDKKWPTQLSPTKYKLGIGDTLTLALIKDDKTNNRLSPTNNRLPPTNSENNQNLIISSQQYDNTINSIGRIGSDGSVLLLEVGRLEASGKSLSELRSEVRNILIRNGINATFQLEISDFKSQRAYLTNSSSQGISSNIINLNDQRTTLLDILASAGISYKPGVVTIVKLRRNNEIFHTKLRDIFITGSAQIHILDRDHIFVEENSAQIVTSLSKVDQGGSVVFAGVGKIKASGLSLDELRNEIENLLEKVPSSQNAFQISITDFLSQTALLITSGTPGAGLTIPITDTPVTLTEVITKNGLRIDANNIARINLQRDGVSYVFTLDDLLEPNNSDIYLQPGDRITSEILSYKENKVFILGGVTPNIFKINPANRQTLADVLFTDGGALSASNAKRSEVYLLRGNDPVLAYHLDAQSPTRLIVADAMELRPNDILYVAEQPIISFNRALATIVPLRILLRDIQNENIP